MPRPRRHSLPEMLDLARAAIRQPGGVTVAQFLAQLGGGTLAEVSGALRAAKMEIGAIPWTPDSVPGPLRAVLVRGADMAAAPPTSTLEHRVAEAMAPVGPLLGHLRDSLDQALEVVQAAAEVQVADARAEAERQALEAWRAVQETLDAAQEGEQDRAFLTAQLLDVRLAASEERETLHADRVALRHALETETERVRVATLASDEAQRTVLQLRADVRTTAEAAATAVNRAHHAEQRAVVAEARLEHLSALERQLREATTAHAGARDAAARSAAEAASMREALDVVGGEVTYLRASLERAHLEAAQAAMRAGAHERELTLLRGADTHSAPE